MLSQIVFTNFLYKQGWTVKKDGYSNAMVGLQTVLKKDNMEMIVRWNDFPLLIEINCTILEKRLLKRYIFYQSDYFKFVTPLFKQCPKGVKVVTPIPPPPPEEPYALLYDDNSYIFGDGYIFLPEGPPPQVIAYCDTMEGLCDEISYLCDETWYN